MVLMVQCEGGHWLAVDERLSGTVVRCAQCKRLVCVPPMALLVPESGVIPPPQLEQLSPSAGTAPNAQPSDSPWSDAPPPVGAAGQAAFSASTVELKPPRRWPAQRKPQPAPPRPVARPRDDAPYKDRADAVASVPSADGDSYIPMAILSPDTGRSLPVAPPRIAETQMETAAGGVSCDELVIASLVDDTKVQSASVPPLPASAGSTIPVAGSALSPPIAVQERRHRRRSVRRRIAAPTIVPPDAYQADQHWITLVNYLAIGLAGAVLFSLLPVLAKGSLNLAIAPTWARVVVLVSALQAAYVVWLVAVPDWAALRVLMYVFAAAAALYALGGALALAAPAERLTWLGLDEVQHAARSWCGAAMAVMMLASYVCGRCAARWRQVWRQQLAVRRRTV